MKREEINHINWKTNRSSPSNMFTLADHMLVSNRGRDQSSQMRTLVNVGERNKAVGINFHCFFGARFLTQPFFVIS